MNTFLLCLLGVIAVAAFVTLKSHRSYTQQLRNAVLDFEGTLRFVCDRQFRKLVVNISDFVNSDKYRNSQPGPCPVDEQFMYQVENSQFVDLIPAAETFSFRQNVAVAVGKAVKDGDSGTFKTSYEMRTATQRFVLYNIPQPGLLPLLRESLSDWLHNLRSGNLQNPLAGLIELCAKYKALAFFRERSNNRLDGVAA